MAFCTSCGKQIEEGSPFCEHCGARQEGTAAPESPAPAAPAAPTATGQSPSYGGQASGQGAGYGAAPGAAVGYGSAPVAAAPRKPIPKGVKIGAVAVVAVVVLAALALFVLGKVNDPQKTVSAFIQSIQDQDYEKFSKVTCPADEELELTQETVAPFFALYSGRSSALEEYQDSLTDDLQQLKQGRVSTGNGLVRLVEKDHFFFKTYQVELGGVEIFFSSPLDDTQVTVGGQTVELAQAEQPYGVQLLPGLYDVEAACTNSLLDETFSTQLKDCQLTQSNHSVYLDLEYSTVVLEDIGMEVTSLTVNGKDYGPVEFNDWGEMELAPLPGRVEVVVTYDVDGVTLSSTFSNIEDSYFWYSFYPDPALSQETAQEMLDQVGVFVRGMMDDYAAGDLSAQEAELGDSPVVRYYVEELENAQDLDLVSRRVFHYTLQELEGDLNWSRDDTEDGLLFSTLIFLGMDYTVDSYWNGELEELEAPEGGYQEEDVMRVYVQRINGQWEVTDLQWAYYYDREDLSDPYTL